MPQGRRCDILSIRTNGWQRHHGDHRRSLVEILNNLAAAVACGKLYILDEDEVGRQATAGEELLDATVGDTAALAAIRDAVDVELAQTRLDDATRRSTILCLSEAVTNMLPARRRQGPGHTAPPALDAAHRRGRRRPGLKLPQLG